MKDAGEYIGMGLMVLFICYGCAHCDRVSHEIKMEERQNALRTPAPATDGAPPAAPASQSARKPEADE